MNVGSVVSQRKFTSSSGGQLAAPAHPAKMNTSIAAYAAMDTTLDLILVISDPLIVNFLKACFIVEEYILSLLVDFADELSVLVRHVRMARRSLR